MKKHLLVALVVLSVMPGVALAQMMGGGMSGSAMPAPAMSSGMQGQGMMPGMMCQGQEMMGGGVMQGGMMGGEMMGAMMSSMMEGMMPGPTRGCMMMAEGMMKGQVDLARVRKPLALSDDQTEKLRAGLRPLQKEAILTFG